MSVFLLVLVLPVLMFIVKGIQIVPQGEEWIVERLGKFHEVLQPGLHLLNPILSKVSYRTSTKDTVLEIPEQEVITKDNAVVMVNAVAFIKITNVQRAVYGVDNFNKAMRNMVQTNLRSIIGGLDLNGTLTSRDHIKATLKEAISSEAEDWGLTVKSVEIQDIKPSKNMQESMERQSAAERERIAVVTEAEGAKQSLILNAEARLEAARKDAEAQKIAADASAESIKSIASSLKNNDGAAQFLMADRYVQSLQKMSTSENAKIVLVPGDIMGAVRAIMPSKL